jgi:hypothetical protein
MDVLAGLFIIIQAGPSRNTQFTWGIFTTDRGEHSSSSGLLTYGEYSREGDRWEVKFIAI